MLTGELARELGLTAKALDQVARLLDVERRCGRLWWTPEKIEHLKQELERRAEVRRMKSLYPRTPEVASRLGVGEGDLRALVHEHGLPVEKDKTSNVYLWTDQAIAAAQALLEDLANRPPEPPAPPPPGMTSKEVAVRLKMQYQSFIYFSLALRRREVSLQPALHKGTLYWSEEDVAYLEKALEESRARPDLRQKNLIKSQKGRLARLQEQARAIRENFRGMSTPQATSVRQRVQSILELCQEIEAALALPLAFINTLPVEGWSLRFPVSVWVRATVGGFEAEAVDLDLRMTSPTRRGAISLLRHALFLRYQELARDPRKTSRPGSPCGNSSSRRNKLGVRRNRFRKPYRLRPPAPGGLVRRPPRRPEVVAPLGATQAFRFTETQLATDLTGGAGSAANRTPGRDLREPETTAGRSVFD